MRTLLTGLVVAGALALSAQAGTAQAAPFSLGSDADFNTWAAGTGFVRLFGGNVRWGNGAANGDWEYSVTDAADLPVDQQQHDWQTGDNPHSAVFIYNAVFGDATLALGGIGLSSGNFFGADVNTLFIRAAANGGQTATMLDNFVVEFADNSFLALGDLIGDANGEWIGVVDPRFAQGFLASAEDALLNGGADGRGSRPMYQFKLGHSQIPEPASLSLLAVGCLGAGLLARRRKHA